ncbi:hypothetical protein MMC07_009712 [Pseudocyphellaria aurata]|nr:hypothetical protein [Pseudocyphellaria aurata]
MLKSSSIVLTSYASLLSPCVGPSSISVANTYPDRGKPGQSSSCFRVPRRRINQCQKYSSVHSQKPLADRLDDLGWPKFLSEKEVPTPYEIFQLDRCAPYSKVRFYELVKLYHPDRCSHEHNPSKHLSTGVRIERYRLAVAANCILSDPIKRKAYDRFGSGWHGQRERGISEHGWSHYGDERSGFSPENSPMYNATWEDWEKWYQKEAGGKQEPVTFSNETFVSLVVLVVALGGMAEATSIRGHSKAFLERTERVHVDCSKNVQTRKEASTRSGNSNDRVERFLRNRDPYGYTIQDSKDAPD